jgi:VWFA-related protein
MLSLPLSLPRPLRALYVLFLSASVLPALSALAQSPAPATLQAASAPQSSSIAQPEAISTVIHTSADLVLVDVVVTERGNAIHGLDKSLFHVFEDGRDQTINSFDEHRYSPPAAGASASPAPLPPNTWTNVPTIAETQTVNVLLLDGLNTLMPDQLRVRQQMLQYAGNIQPGTPMAIFTLSSRLRMVKGFTGDPAELIKTLTSRNGKPQISILLDRDTVSGLQTSTEDMASSPAAAGLQQFVAEANAVQVDQRVRMTLDAMQQLGRYLSGFPGRKNVIWLSGSFPIALDPVATLNNPFEAMRSYSDDIRKTSDLLTAARVAVYPVDARGLVALPSADASRYLDSSDVVTGAGRGVAMANMPSSARDDAQFVKLLAAEQASMKQIAEETGGQEYINTNGLKEAVASAVENGGSYYTLGYVPAAKSANGKFHKIQVTAEASHYKLAYRRGYYADPPAKPSAHTMPSNGLIEAAMLPGAPPDTQIWFTARVLPDTDPLFKNIKMPVQPLGDAAATLKGPLHRYIVDLKVDPHWLSYEQTPEGAQKAVLDFELAAYDNQSKRVNYIEKGFRLSLGPENYSRIMSSGITARLGIDLPQGEFALRIVVHDLSAGHAGSLEVPLAVVAE